MHSSINLYLESRTDVFEFARGMMPTSCDRSPRRTLMIGCPFGVRSPYFWPRGARTAEKCKFLVSKLTHKFLISNPRFKFKVRKPHSNSSFQKHDCLELRARENGTVLPAGSPPPILRVLWGVPSMCGPSLLQRAQCDANGGF